MATVETLNVKVKADTKDFKNELDRASQAAGEFAGSMTSAFEAVALRGQDFGEAMRGVARDLSSSLLRSALQPVFKGLGNSLFGGLARMLPFAAGGALAGGKVKPFANGGVIDAPTAFPLRGGLTGLAGEAGPEAILPLKRGAGGELGVQAGGATRPLSVTFNIATPDVEGFRRSETQIAAMVSRALARGERNL